jgi:5-methylcytosine-specific restriction enzyme A
MNNRRVGDKVYHSTAWRKLRRSYYTQQYGLCERCGRPGDIVHHKIPITTDNVDNPEITLNEELLELLCISCHNKEHYLKHSPIREGLAFDEFGQLIKIKE